MSKKLPIKGFMWVSDTLEIDDNFVKNYDENDGKGFVLEVDVDYSIELHKLHSDILFLPERMVINNTKKLVCNFNNKRKYVIHISVLKQALNHGL